MTPADTTMRSPHPPDANWRTELLSVLNLSGTLAGLSVTALALLHTFNQNSTNTTVVDDMLAVCSLLFLLCAYAAFWALKTRKPRLAQTLVRVTDILFLASFTLMIVATFLMVYTVW